MNSLGEISHINQQFNQLSAQKLLLTTEKITCDCQQNRQAELYRNRVGIFK